MKNIAKRFVSDESGATAIEYGLIAAIMGVAVVTIFTAFGGKLKGAFETLGTGLETQATKVGTATGTP